MSDETKSIMMRVISLAIGAAMLLSGDMVLMQGIGWLLTIILVPMILGATADVVVPSRRRQAAMSVGVVEVPGEDRNRLSMDKLDKWTNGYENRLKHWHFHSCLATELTYLFLLWYFANIATIICVAMYAQIAALIVSEIRLATIYKTIKDNKTIWGAASYLNEIQELSEAIPGAKKVGKEK